MFPVLDGGCPALVSVIQIPHDGRPLVVVEAENLLVRELGQFMLEGVDLVCALLGGGFGRGFHAGYIILWREVT